MRETVYLVPGLLCDATIWAHQIAALSVDYDVKVPSLTCQSSIIGMAEDIVADAPSRFAIAGHSMGARVALAVLALVPERVDRIALLDTGVHPATADEPARRQELLDISAASGMRTLADRWLPPMVAEGALDSDPGLHRALYAMVERMTPAIYRAQIAALLTRPDARTLLESITVPTLIGVGEYDRWSPPSQHKAIADAIPHARYVVFAGSGHMAPLEAPAEVTEALLQWLREPVTS